MNREHVTTAELVGRLGQKPELQHTPDQTPYVQLSIATSESYTARGGQIQERTEWHRAVAWGDLAKKIASEFDKGQGVVLSGAMRINSYEHDGVKNRTTELHVEKIEPNRDPSLSRNEARLVGVVREQPQTRTFENGRVMTMLSLATTTVANGKEREDWHSVTLWGKTAEAAARDISAGDTVAINGVLRHRSVPQNGQEKKLSAIECSKFQVLERSRDRVKEDPEPKKDKELPGPAASADKPMPRRRQRDKGIDRGV
jgi:single-strand DNA-binding protein